MTSGVPKSLPPCRRKPKFGDSPLFSLTLISWAMLWDSSVEGTPRDVRRRCTFHTETRFSAKNTLNRNERSSHGASQVPHDWRRTALCEWGLLWISCWNLNFNAGSICIFQEGRPSVGDGSGYLRPPARYPNAQLTKFRRRTAVSLNF